MFSLSHVPVVSMPPPVVLSTLPPPLLLFAYRSPAGCCVACCRMPLPCITFCRAATSCVYPQPPIFVCASWLLCSNSLHGLCFLMRRRLTAGCVVVATNAQALCRQCAGVFAVVAITIVALVSCRQAGVVALIIIVTVDVHRHCHRCRISSQCCHCCHRRCPSRRRHHPRLHRPSHRYHCRCCHRSFCWCPSWMYHCEIKTPWVSEWWWEVCMCDI